MAAELLNMLSEAILPSDEDSESSTSESELSPSLSPRPRQRKHGSSRRREKRSRKYSRESYTDNIGEVEEPDTNRRDRRSRRNRHSSMSDTHSRRSKKKTTTKKQGASNLRMEARDYDKQIEYVASEHVYCHEIDAEEGMEVSVLTMPTVLQNTEYGGSVIKDSPPVSPMPLTSSYAATMSKPSDNANFENFASLHDKIDAEGCYERENSRMPRYAPVPSLHRNEESGDDEGVANNRHGRHQRPCDPTTYDYNAGPELSAAVDQEVIDEPPAMRMWKQRYSNSPLRPRCERDREVAGPEPVNEPPALRTMQHHFPQQPEVQHKETEKEKASPEQVDEPPTLRKGRAGRHHVPQQPEVRRRNVDGEMICPELVDEPPSLKMVSQHFSDLPQDAQKEMGEDIARPEPVEKNSSLDYNPVHSLSNGEDQEAIDEPPAMRMWKNRYSQSPMRPRYERDGDMQSPEYLDEPPALRTTQQRFSHQPVVEERKTEGKMASPERVDEQPRDPQRHMGREILGSYQLDEPNAPIKVQQHYSQRADAPDVRSAVGPPALETVDQKYKHQPKMIGELGLEDKPPALRATQHYSHRTIHEHEQIKESATSINPVIAESSYTSFSSISMNHKQVEMQLSQPTDEISEAASTELDGDAGPTDCSTTPKIASQNRFVMPASTSKNTSMPTTPTSWPSMTTSDPKPVVIQTWASEDAEGTGMASTLSSSSTASSIVSNGKLSKRRFPLSSLKEKVTKSTSKVHPRKLFSSSQLPKIGGSARSVSNGRDTGKESGLENSSEPTAQAKNEQSLPPPESERSLSTTTNQSSSRSPIGAALVSSDSLYSAVMANVDNEDDTVFHFNDDEIIDSEFDRDAEQNKDQDISKIEESCPKYFSRQIDDAMTSLWSANITSGETRISLDDPFEELKCVSDHHDHQNRSDKDLNYKKIVHELVTVPSPTSVAIGPTFSPPGSQHSSEEGAMMMSVTSELMNSVAFSEPKFTPSFASKDDISADDESFSMLEDDTMIILTERNEEETATVNPLYSSNTTGATESTMEKCAKGSMRSALPPRHNVTVTDKSSAIKLKREHSEDITLPCTSIPQTESKTTSGATLSSMAMQEIEKDKALPTAKPGESTLVTLDGMSEKEIKGTTGTDKIPKKEACQTLETELSSSERNNSPASNSIEKIKGKERILPPTSTPSSTSSSYLRRMRLSKALAARARSNRGNSPVTRTKDASNPLCTPPKVTTSLEERQTNGCSDECATISPPSAAEPDTRCEYRTISIEGGQTVQVTQIDCNQPSKSSSANLGRRDNNSRYSEAEVVSSEAQDYSDSACATSSLSTMPEAKLNDLNNQQRQNPEMKDDELLEIVTSEELPEQELSGVYGEQFLADEEATIPIQIPAKEMPGMGESDSTNAALPQKGGITKDSTEDSSVHATQLVVVRGSEERMGGKLPANSDTELSSIHIDPNGMISEKVQITPMVQRIPMRPTNSIGDGTCGMLTKDSQNPVHIIQRVFRGWRSCYHLLRMMGVAKRRRWEPRTKSINITRIHSDIRRKARVSLREQAKKSAQERGRKVKFVSCCMAIAVRRVCVIQLQRWWLQKRWRLRIQKKSCKTPSITQVTGDFSQAEAVVIQANTRGYIQRKRLLKENLAAAQIQSLFRCYRCWNHFNKNIMPSIILIQSFFRMFIYHKMQKSVEQVRVSRSKAETRESRPLHESLSVSTNKDASNDSVTASSTDGRVGELYSKINYPPCDATSLVASKDRHLNDEKTWVDLDPPLDCLEKVGSTPDIVNNPDSAGGMGRQSISMPSSVTPAVSRGSESSGSQTNMETDDNLQTSAWDHLQNNLHEVEDSSKRSSGSKKLLSKRRGVLGKIRSKFGGSSSSFLSRSSAENNADRLVDFFGNGDGLSRPTPPLPDVSSISLTSSMSDEGKQISGDKNDLREAIPRAKSPSRAEQGVEAVGSTPSAPAPKMAVKDPAFLIQMRADNFMEEMF